MKKMDWIWSGVIALASVVLLATPVLVTLNTPATLQAKLNNIFAGLQAAGTVLAVLALVAAFSQVREARKQLRENRSWNKMSFALTFLPQMEMLRTWELELDSSCVRLIHRDGELSDAEVNQIFAPENHHVHLKLKMYLNALESYCVAVNSGLAHEEVARRIWEYKLSRHWMELLPYVRRARAKAKDNGIYCEIQKLHEKWTAEPAPTATYGQDSE